MRACPRLLVASALLATLGGCATSAPSTARQPDPPQIRCLSERDSGPSRPLFFLFCIQSP